MKISKFVNIVSEDIQDIVSEIEKDFGDKEVQIIKLDKKVNVDYLKEVQEFEGNGIVKLYNLDDWTDEMVIVTDDLSEQFDLILESSMNLN